MGRSTSKMTCTSRMVPGEIWPGHPLRVLQAVRFWLLASIGAALGVLTMKLR